VSIRNRHHTNPLRAPRQLIDEAYLLTGSPRAESNTVVQESLYGAVEGS
jgi:hypothetical protein